MGPTSTVSDLEDSPSDFSFMVPMESLLVASGADDGRLVSLLKQVNRVLLSLRGSVLVKGLYSRGTMIKAGGQYCFGSVCEEERCEPYGLVWRCS